MVGGGRYPPAMLRRVAAFFASADNRGRLLRCVVGLVLSGVGFSSLLRADLGLDPWDVFHQGVSERLGVPIGMVAVVTGFVVLLLWIPLRERPGPGTILNAVLIGSVMDLLLPRIPEAGSWPIGAAMLGGGIVISGIGMGLYIGAGLGPGPRDGVMTGLARRGVSIRLARTGLEMTALVVGWTLGGQIGIGTLVFALTIGPVVQVSLARLSLPERTGSSERRSSARRQHGQRRVMAGDDPVDSPGDHRLPLRMREDVEALGQDGFEHLTGDHGRIET